MNALTINRLVVVGASAGGLDALGIVLSELPSSFPHPILIVQHIGASSDGFMIKHLNRLCKLNVKEAADKEDIMIGHVYIAPPNYHILVEDNFQISLSVDEKVNHSRPSIDVLFESAAYVFGSKVIAIILTGASADGANGSKLIEEMGGKVIIQDPLTAVAKTMPESALKKTMHASVLKLEDIVPYLIKNA